MFKKMISLGFADEKVAAGTHICQIFTEDEERNNSLLQFIISGIQGEERAACFSEKLESGRLNQFFSDHQLSCEALCDRQALTLSGAKEVYFENGCFDPQRMLNLLSEFYTESINLGFSGSRVIGEMSPEIETVPGGSRLLEYEARVSLLLETHPVTTVCQYDASAFDGATIMDILKVHPFMVVRGAVVHNPFFIPPEEFLN